MESRWLRWVGPGLIALGAVGSIASTATGAGQRPWTPRTCEGGPGSRAAAARLVAPTELGDLRVEAWFRLDSRLDRDGVLQGQRLALGIDGDRSSQTMDLPAESFAAGPFGGIVLVGTDDSSTSQLEAVNVAGGCSWTVAQESDVIRRATIDPAGETIYEMRVDRITRADLGIWSRPLDGTVSAVPILEPIAADDRYGRTYTTEFAWDVSGTALAVQSCGEAACRTRVIDPAGGSQRLIDEPDLGTLVGIDGDVLVSYAACPGFPCPILAVNVRTHAREVLADAGAVAVLTATVEGIRLVHEVFDESGVSLRAVALDGSSATDLGRMPEGLRLQANAGGADAATRVPSGWVLLDQDGRLPPDGPDANTQLRHVPDGTTVQLDEVAR